MQLSREHVKKIKPQPGLVIPDEKLFDLPEKVLQFGTGVLLRGLPCYFIDKANRNGIFNGRVVIVKSTSSGGTDAFQKQDGLYTLCIRGVEQDHKTDEAIIHSCISRVLSANKQWDDILACASNPDMQVVISNTTEVGISYLEENVLQGVPSSFPGKLLAFLYARYQAFKGSVESGMVIIPTELIMDNGAKLRSILLDLAAYNKFGTSFINWLREANHFCNSLVDRIVPGKLTDSDQRATEKKLGYKDELMIMAETFRLWAIESDNERVSDILAFTKADEGAVIASSIEKFRELKLRLLNGTHSFSCGLACLAGFSTVREAVSNDFFRAFLHNLMQREIVPAITGENITSEEAIDFSRKVLDRFRNPYLDHQWLSISVQYSSKMKMRNVPLLLNHFNRSEFIPEHMAMGFAAFLLFMKSARNARGQFEGMAHGKTYVIQDDNADYFSAAWYNHNVESMVDTILSDKDFWGADLSELKGFGDAVKWNLKSLISHGVMMTIRRVQPNKIMT